MRNNALVVAVVVMFCFVVAACAAVFVASPDGANTGSLITILLGSLASTIAALAALAGVARVDGKADKMLNGVMDHKIKHGVHAAMDERDSNETVTTSD